MGQAKLRGTYEQRSAQAEQRAAEERAERERKEAERVAAMTPEERERYSNRKHQRYLNNAMVIGMLMAPFAAGGRRRRQGKA